MNTFKIGTSIQVKNYNFSHFFFKREFAADRKLVADYVTFAIDLKVLRLLTPRKSKQHKFLTAAEAAEAYNDDRIIATSHFAYIIQCIELI